MNRAIFRCMSMASLGLATLFQPEHASLTLGGLTLATIVQLRATQADSALRAPSQQSGDPREGLAERERLNSQAITLRAEGKHAEALALYVKKLTIERAALGDGHDDVVATLRRIAELHSYLGDFESARKSAQEALEIQSKLPNTKRWQIAEARRTLDLVEELSKMDRSRRRKLVEIDRLSDQVPGLYVDGKFRDGIKLAQQILEISQQTLGDGHPDLAASLNNLGVFQHSTGNYARAEPLYRRALDIFKTAVGEEHPDYVTTFNNLAVLQAQRGDFERALPLYRRALALRKEAVGEKHPDYVRSVNNLAWLHKSTGDFSSAESLYLQALHLHEQGLSYGWPNGRILEIFRQVDVRRPSIAAKSQTDLALIMGNLAMCYQEMGDYARAEPLYRKALEINKKTFGEQSAAYARILNNLALVDELMGDYVQAEALFQKAVALRKTALGDQHPDYATSLQNLGRFYHMIDQYDRAEPLYLQALAIRKQTLGETHPYYAATLDKLASLYHAKGDYARAEPLYVKALEARKISLGEKRHYDATILTNQALLYDAMGKYDQAEALFQKSLDVARKQGGEQHPEYARTLHHLAMLYFAGSKHDDADHLAREAADVSRSLMERCAGVQSERQQLAMMQTSRFYLDGYLTVAAQAKVASERVYGQILAWKGAVLVRQRHVHLQRSHPELAGAFAQLNRMAGRLASLALAVPEPNQEEAVRRQIEELSEQKDRLEGDLASRSAAFREQSEAARLVPASLQATLPADAALVDFLEYTHRRPPAPGQGRWSFERRLAAFVVRPGSLQQLDLGPTQPIAAAIDRWRATHAAGIVPAPGDADPGAELRKRLWEPLADHLRAVKVVLVSPDGPLNGLPLAALPGAGPDQFLVHEYAFATIAVPHMLPELLRGTLRSAQEPPSLLLAGGITFGAGRAREGESRGGKLGSLPVFGELHGAESEVNDLRTEFVDAFPEAAAPKVLRKDKATKDAVLAAAPLHRFVHLATHGFFADESQPSAMAVAQRAEGLERGLRLQADATGRHPGLLSGVVFAGVNRPDRRPEETILTALEAGELDLRKVELVVLSACETGRGRVAGGEGVLGLQRAFQLAGARSVVASLWKVPDEETHQLMREFYRHVWSEKPVSKAEALRQAQLWMLENWNGRGTLERPAPQGPLPPFYWAAFVLSGDWR